MHEENFLSSWSREDGREREEGTVQMGNESKEERGEKRRREGEKEENKTGTVKRRCDGFVSEEAFDFFLVEGEIWRVACCRRHLFQGGGEGEGGGVSWVYLLPKNPNSSAASSRVAVIFLGKTFT